MGRIFTCAQCDGTFETGWSEEEARAEQAANGWGDMPEEIMTQQCDDCYKELMPMITPPLVHGPREMVLGDLLAGIYMDYIRDMLLYGEAKLPVWQLSYGSHL